MKNPTSLLFVLLVSLFTMCKTNKPVSPVQNATMPLIIYKTKADYSRLVPVQMNKAKDKIISYPAPGDLTFRDKPAIPEKLKHGYLLDNMGIGANSAFTSYTFEDYAQRKSAPALKELMDHIIDNDPFTEIWQCGSRNEVKTMEELNTLIDSGFESCKSMK